MKTYYCGFNGFGQFPGKDADTFSVFTPILFPFDVVFVSCAWNRIFFSTGSEAYLSGFIDGECRKLEKLAIPDGKIITQGSCSRSNVLVITKDGVCWMRQVSGDWKNISDLLRTEVDSHEMINEAIHPNTPFDTEHKITNVCCDDNINLAICNLGQIYSIPSALPIPGKKVVEIACGFDHCIALTDDNIVYTWGSGRGQLGHDVLEDEDSPRELEMLSGLKVKNISAGGWHSVAVTSTGDAYVWGWNSSGQLGLPCSETPERITEGIACSVPRTSDKGVPSSSSKEDKRETKEITTIQALPILVNFPQGDEGKLITAASCGSRHTVMLTDDGAAWGCGWNAYGQLGLKGWSLYEKLTKITIPVQEQSKVTNIVCGSWSTVLFVNN